MIIALGFLIHIFGVSDADVAQELKNIWSPYCKGISLLECPSTKAEHLRNEIYRRAKEGESFQTIYSDLEARYGQGVLQMAPSQSGRDGLSYWLPWAIFILAFALVMAYRPFVSMLFGHALQPSFSLMTLLRPG